MYYKTIFFRFSVLFGIFLLAGCDYVKLGKDRSVLAILKFLWKKLLNLVYLSFSAVVASLLSLHLLQFFLKKISRSVHFADTWIIHACFIYIINGLQRHRVTTRVSCKCIVLVMLLYIIVRFVMEIMAVIFEKMLKMIMLLRNVMLSERQPTTNPVRSLATMNSPADDTRGPESGNNGTITAPPNTDHENNNSAGDVPQDVRPSHLYQLYQPNLNQNNPGRTDGTGFGEISGAGDVTDNHSEDKSEAGGKSKESSRSETESGETAAHPTRLDVPSTASGISSTAVPSISSTAVPSISSTAEPSTSSTAEPSTSSTAEPSTSSTAEPSTSSTAEPSMSSTAEPSMSSTAEPSMSSTAEPSTSSSKNPRKSSRVRFDISPELPDTTQLRTRRNVYVRDYNPLKRKSKVSQDDN